MDLIDQIILFLKESNLESSAQAIETERKPHKPTKDPESPLKSAIKTQFPNLPVGESFESMQKFIKKIQKKPIIRPSLPTKRKKPSEGTINISTPPTSSENKSTSLKSQVESEFKFSSLDPSINLPKYTNPITQASLLAFEAEESKFFLNLYENSLTPEDFIIIECKSEELQSKIQEILQKNPEIPFQSKLNSKKKNFSLSPEKSNESLLPAFAKFPVSADPYYPIEKESVMLDCFMLKVVFDRYTTGFVETKEFVVNINELIAGRYKVVNFLPSGNFSKVLYCIDTITGEKVCLKIIENTKEATDSSIDEIKVMRFISVNGNLDEKNIVKFKDCIYHKEHVVIVTELLRDNLRIFLDQSPKNKTYFTMGRIQKLAFAILKALEFIHSLQIIHADVKPENILFKSFSAATFKLIDFGSARFVHDELSNYAQSRNYRAPEVILGFHYDFKVDIWSLGCVLFEVFTGKVLFDCTTVQEFLAKVISLFGPFPEDVYKFGLNSKKYFTKEKVIYLELDEKCTFESLRAGFKAKKKYKLYVPQRTCLKAKLNSEDLVFVDFIRSLLTPDRYDRPSASEALAHPFLSENRYVDGID